RRRAGSRPLGLWGGDGRAELTPTTRSAGHRAFSLRRWSGPASRRQPGPPFEGFGQHLQHASALLTRRGQVAADAQEAARPGHRPPAARDLVVQLGHPEVALDLIVGEGHSEVIEEAQHLGAVLFQPAEQVGGLALPSARTWRVLPLALPDDVVVAALELGH